MCLLLLLKAVGGFSKYTHHVPYIIMSIHLIFIVKTISHIYCFATI